MGTLFNQQPRMEYFHSYGVKFIGTVKELAKKNNLTIEETCRILELTMKIDDYDRKDEQLAGIGELIKEMNDQIMGLSGGLRAISERLRDMNENVVLVSLEDKE
ncbi:hypothetical protein BTB_7p00060 (plasmid) [Bacillus thuringiensis Bt407]|uniref:Uncharacterized protein n=4 Tax=Bacillus cereus group TaxID=86661 RepID=A0A9X6K7W3_BACTU|nr:hypothetical protein BTB_7p00060 [Bacillus thuringiensis Bt407]AHZ55147.1 hypothetical protein YBT1520_34271 [Bacillus thuringiensis serovar kurstaki str. YBT-1520]AIE37848.1 hypothetical protein BTK_35286 [Bacillus thuringiensis serovar kurstaki str. HD-1]AJK44526.1 hypothetical protein BG08_7108 [Bacillus thuringiensis serovar kurstaki]EJQ02636.1 hypothetical protein IE3_05684 [Bacillus cereus BAG3X2-1]EJV71405.1 hypothetical protein IG1_05990 [Bacillus cereus HD73]EOP14147.1 hypothetica